MKVVNVKKTGPHIKEMFKERGLKVREVSEYLSLTSPTGIYTWFSGSRMPSIDHLVMLADMMDCKVDDIIITEEI